MSIVSKSWRRAASGLAPAATGALKPRKRAVFCSLVLRQGAGGGGQRRPPRPRVPRPLSPEEMSRLAVKLEPFHAGQGLPWMRPGYRDGEAG